MTRLPEKISACLLLLLLVIACRKSEVPAPDVEEAEKILKDVFYGQQAAQKMDVYLPANRSTSSTKVIILIHGGGWNSGDKADLNPYVDSLRRREPSYAIFNINYRLFDGNTNRFPAQENDVKTAIEFIVNKSAEYKISNKIVLIGASAGAHLALLHAYKYASPVKIKAVVDFFGPADLISLYNNPPNPLVPLLLSAVTGHTPSGNNAIYYESSPLNYVNAASSPTIILQGGVDPVVPPVQSELLRNKLQAEGLAHQYVFYPLEGHGWTGSTLSDSFNKIQAFLALYVD